MIINPFFEKISNCGILETDSVQEKLNKRILCITSFLITIAGFLLFTMDFGWFFQFGCRDGLGYSCPIWSSCISK